MRLLNWLKTARNIVEKTGIPSFLRAVPSSHYALLAALFFIGLELLIVFHSWVLVFSGIFLLLILYGIVLLKIEERGRFHPTQVILPLLTASGLTGFAFFLPTTPQIHLYFLGASLIFFWLLKHGARKAYPTWNWVISLIVLFLNVAVILGIRALLYTPVVVVLVMISTVAFLISAQALKRVAPSLSYTVLLALVISLVLAQVAWVLQFLPIHSLVQAGIISVVYYSLFHLLEKHLTSLLTRGRLLEYLGLGAAGILVLLLSARWI